MWDSLWNVDIPVEQRDNWSSVFSQVLKSRVEKVKLTLILNIYIVHYNDADVLVITAAEWNQKNYSIS